MRRLRGYRVWLDVNHSQLSNKRIMSWFDSVLWLSNQNTENIVRISDIKLWIVLLHLLYKQTMARPYRTIVFSPTISKATALVWESDLQSLERSVQNDQNVVYDGQISCSNSAPTGKAKYSPQTCTLGALLASLPPCLQRQSEHTCTSFLSYKAFPCLCLLQFVPDTTDRAESLWTDAHIASVCPHWNSLLIKSPIFKGKSFLSPQFLEMIISAPQFQWCPWAFVQGCLNI